MISPCKFCGMQPVRQLNNMTQLVEVFCRCGLNRFVAYGDNQAEAVKLWNDEQDEKGGDSFEQA